MSNNIAVKINASSVPLPSNDASMPSLLTYCRMYALSLPEGGLDGYMRDRKFMPFSALTATFASTLLLIVVRRVGMVRSTRWTWRSSWLTTPFTTRSMYPKTSGLREQIQTKPVDHYIVTPCTYIHALGYIVPLTAIWSGPRAGSVLTSSTAAGFDTLSTSILPDGECEETTWQTDYHSTADAYHALLHTPNVRYVKVMITGLTTAFKVLKSKSRKRHTNHRTKRAHVLHPKTLLLLHCRPYNRARARTDIRAYSQRA